ncbi:hypothetical protein ABI59_03205 [Acidobacteria bacterium Mor1]|nr:hypothetical protein ABI59_03205 [Acidobacteria bacterium Mor1]
MKRPDHPGPWLLIGAACLFGLVMLFHEVGAGSPPSKNDQVLHDAMTSYAARHGGEHYVVNHWYPSIAGGFPVFAHYPHLSHVVGAAVTRLLPIHAEPHQVYGILNWLVLSLMPLGIYAGMRRMDFAPWAAAFAGAIYPFVMANPYLGIGWEAFLDTGSGLMPQLWGVFFLFAALGWGWRAVHGGPRVIAGLLVAAAAMSHSVFGYMAAASIALAALIPYKQVITARRFFGLGIVGLITLLVSIYFIGPFYQHIDQVLKSQWEATWKYDGIGLMPALQKLWNGDLFDTIGRGIQSLPGTNRILTIAVGVSALVGLVQGIRLRDGRRLWLLAGMLLWFALYAGRTAWGGLVDILPFAWGLPMHRFGCGVQIFGLLLAGVALEDLRKLAVERLGAKGGVAVGVLLAALMVFPAAKRVAFVQQNKQVVQQRKQALDQADDYRALGSTLWRAAEGRVYAGMYYNWGKDFTVADLPVYAMLQRDGFDMIGYPFIGMSYPTEWMVRQPYAERQDFEMWGIRWIVAPPGQPMPPWAVPRARMGRFALYEIPGSTYFGFGRVYPLPSKMLSTGDVATAEMTEVYDIGQQWLMEFDPESARYLAMTESIEPLPDTGPPQGELLEMQTHRSGIFSCRARVGEPTDLILRVTYHPRWKAFVNAEQAEITRIFPGFMSIRLPPGEHVVDFRYQGPSYQKWLFTLPLALFAWTAALNVGRKAQPKAPGRPPAPEGDSRPEDRVDAPEGS